MKGLKINGYKIGRLLGRGSFGEVYLLVNIKTGERFAGKCFSNNMSNNDLRYKLLKQEILTLKVLDHKNIIKFDSVIETDSCFCLLMEECYGGNLEDYILNNGNFDEKTARIIIKQVIEALLYIHDMKICHRDIKPSNILITNFPEIKVSDFGLSKIMNSQNMCSTACGTILFSSPESFYGDYDGASSDIYSAGVVLYTILKGKVPWKSSNITKLVQEMKNFRCDIPDISPQCSELIETMLSFKSKDRPSAREILKSSWFEPENEQKLQAPRSKTDTTDMYSNVNPNYTHNTECTSPKKILPKLKMSFEII